MNAQPKLRIRVDLSERRAPARQDLSRQNLSTAPSPRRKLRVFEFGNIRIPYGRYTSGKVSYWMLFYGRGKDRKRESRVSFKALEKRAGDIAIAIQNGQLQMAQFTEDQRASHRRCLEIAGKLNPAPSLELLISEAVEARLASRAKIVHKTCPQAADELITFKENNLRRKKWIRSALKPMLDRLAEYYTGPIDALLPVLNDWLGTLKGGPVYRKHHRDAAAQLLRFACGKGWLRYSTDELERELRTVDNPELPEIEIRTWSPEQVVKLLASTYANMIPFTTLQVFAGIRHEELNPEAFDLAKRPLDWEDVNWETGQIHVPKKTAKTGESRLVPMEPNLVAWLLPHRKVSGRICEVSNTSNCLSRAKHRARLPAGRGDSRNVLRKTYISARVAITKNRGLVAEESGTSIAKMKSNYKAVMTETQAKRLFNIFPTHADILQIPLGLK